MKTLDEYEKEAEIQMGLREKDGSIPSSEFGVNSRSYFTSDVTNRMLILAMRDFITELPDVFPFHFDSKGKLKVK